MLSTSYSVFHICCARHLKYDKSDINRWPSKTRVNFIFYFPYMTVFLRINGRILGNPIKFNTLFKRTNKRLRFMSVSDFRGSRDSN